MNRLQVLWPDCRCLALWKDEPSAKSQFIIKMWCRTVLPSLMVWVLVTAVGTLGRLCQCRVPAGTVPPFPGCVEVSGFITKCIPTDLGIVSISSQSLTKLWDYLESFPPQGQSKWGLFPWWLQELAKNLDFFFKYHKLLHKISDLMLEWLGSASLSSEGMSTDIPQPAHVPW